MARHILILKHRGSLAALVLTIAVVAGCAWLVFHRPSRPSSKSTSPVPANIKQSISFPIYYTDPSKLPSGYSFNPDSFSAGSGVVEFTVTHGQAKIVFTEQPKPSAQALDLFNSSRIPLHNSVDTPVGTALVGALGGHTFISLPTNSSTWMLISAPNDVGQTGLDQVLLSLSK